MPSYGPDCKRLANPDLCEQFKTETCSVPLFITKKYRRYESRPDTRPVRDKALNEIPSWDKKYATDTIRLINSSGPGSNQPGPNSQLLGSSSSTGSSGVECCGPEFKEADTQKIINQTLVFEYRSTATDGPTMPRTYKFGYKGINRQACKSICQQAFNRLQNWTNNPANRNHPNFVSTVEFVYRLSFRIALAENNPALYEGIFADLQISGGVPLTNKTIEVTDNEKTLEYDLNQNWELEYLTAFKCRDNQQLQGGNYLQDETRACCRCKCSSSSSCIECGDFSDCPINKKCDIPQGASLGCCTDDCNEPCNQASECVDYPVGPNGEPVTCRQGCCWVGDCRWGEWTPNSNEVDCGLNYTQTRVLLEGSLEDCIPPTREWTGTKDCCERTCQSDPDCESLGPGYYCQENDLTGELCCRKDNESSSVSGQISLGLKSYLGLGVNIEEFLTNGNSDLISSSEISNILERIKKEI